MRLAPKLTILFLLLSILPITVVGYLAYENGRQTIVQETIDHLVSINLFKGSELKRWIEDDRSSIEELAQRPLVRNYATVLKKHDIPDHPYRKAKTNIIEDHLKPRLKYGGFFELFLICPRHGLISASTNEKQEGKYRDTSPYYIEGKSHTYIQGVYYSPALEQPAMTISTPIIDKQGNLVGVLAGRLDLRELSKIISIHTSENQTEDTYLVNNFNFFVTEPRFGQNYMLKKTIHTDGVEAGLSGKEGIGFYKDYRGVSVIGAYKWLPEFNMCIITEIDQAKAFAPIVRLARVIASVVFAISIVAALLGLFFARTITRPVQQLVVGADKIGSGNLEHQVGMASKDEIGGLSRAFDRMAKSLKTTMVSRDELAKSEERFRIAAASASDLIWDWDIASGRLDWFGEIDRILGFEPGEFPHTLDAWEKSIHSDDVARVNATLERHLKEGRPYYEEYRIKCKDGTYRYWTDQGTALRDEKGKPYRMIGACSDITERKRAEEGLRESEERYRIIAENVDDIVWQLDINLQFVYISPSVEHVLGYQVEETLKMHVTEILDQDGLAWMKQYIQNRLTTEKLATPNEYKMKHKDGHWVIVEVVSSPVYDNEGHLVGFAGVTRDISERKRAEEALRESEEKFRKLTETTTAAMFIYQGTKLRYVNPMSEIFTGYTKEELLVMDFWELIHPDQRDLAKNQGLARQEGEEVPPRYEFKILTKNGEMRWADFTGTSIELEGKPAVLGTAYDITERKQTEDALRQSEEKYRSILENIEEGYCEVDLAGNFIFLNDSICRIFGYPKEELMGMNYRRYTDEEDAKGLYQVFNKVYRTGKPHTGYDYQIIRKDGTKRYIETSASLLKDSSDKPIGFRGVIRDITDHKLAETALKESEERYRIAIEHSNDGVAINKGDLYLYVNQKFLKIFGYKHSEEILGKSLWITVHPDDRDHVMEFTRKRQAGEDIPSRYDFKGVRKKGDIIYIEASATKTIYRGEAVSLVYLRDITERRLAEEKMIALQEQLNQAQRMEAIGRLAGGVAHDFNNILTVIKGYAQLSLKEMKEDNPFWGNIEEINISADRAAILTRQLLAFSRRQIMEMKVVNLNMILQNLDKMLHRVIGEDIELVFQLAEDLGRVKVDPGQIEQVMMNLVVNARDAMPKGGKLTIETANAVLDEEYARSHIAVKPGPYVMLSVSDTGIGMTPEVRERLFEPFFTTKETGKGTGLGLSTVYGIVKQSGGNIWVYSELARGTTFKIYLPQMDEDLEELTEKVETRELPRGFETVLIVEDNKEVRKLAICILENQGYKVLEASQGSEALPLCKEYQEPIHLMLTDVVMPGLDGRRLAERAKSFHSEMKVLYMSGYTENTIIHHGVLEKGMNYIQKPFTVDGLARKVREALDKDSPTQTSNG